MYAINILQKSFDPVLLVENLGLIEMHMKEVRLMCWARNCIIQLTFFFINYSRVLKNSR